MKLQKFDYQIKDNRKNKSFIVVGLLLVALVVGVVLYKSFAVYTSEDSYNIIKGAVGEFTVVPLKITYNLVGEDGGVMSSSEIPSSKEYEYDAASSNCVNGNTIVYDKDNNTIVIGDNSEGLEDTCNIYFNYIPLSLRTLYALNLTKDDILNKDDSTKVPYGPTGTGEMGWYAAPDNYGTSYYFYSDGSDTHPIVDINGEPFLIIRINGNGTVKILKTTSDFHGKFNNFSDDNTYVGLMVGQTGTQKFLETHSNITKSLLLDSIDRIFSVYDYIDLGGDSIYCNDRTLHKEEYGEKETDDTTLGTEKNTTYYGAYYRLKNNKPSLMCERKEDSFTIEESELGNGLLTIPFGALTVDELYMINAQALYDQWNIGNINTISPAYFKDGAAYIYEVSGSVFTPIKADAGFYVYQVLNLKSDLEYEGNGTWDALYTIVQ